MPTPKFNPNLMPLTTPRLTVPRLAAPNSTAVTTPEFNIQIAFTPTGMVVTDNSQVYSFSVKDAGFVFDFVTTLLQRALETAYHDQFLKQPTVTVCPQCGKELLQYVNSNKWQCSNCGYTIKHYER